MKKIFLSKWGFVIFLVLLIGSRFINLDNSARFTRDESSDLARMHEYWSAKKITLVGPISNDNVKVFGSLTYYMLMPFAVLGNFDPVSTAYGAAFWSVLTGILLLLLVQHINPKLTLVAGLLIIVWYPLLESGRWAWNPHLMPFWFALGIALIFLVKKKLIAYFLGGVCFGLATHNHYIAIIPAITYLAMELASLFKNRQWQLFLSLVSGFVLSLMPFIIFDLRHPPGLFIAGYIGGRTPHLQTVNSWETFFAMLIRNIYVSAESMARDQFWTTMLMISSLLLIVTDALKKQYQSLGWLMPVAALIGAGVLLDGFATRYFLAGIVFYFLWLIQKRKGVGKLAQGGVIAVLIVSSLTTSLELMTKPQLPPSTRIVKAASDAIIAMLNEYPEIKNANITTDMSEDLDMLAEKYRDYLSIRGVSFRAASEYDVSEHLFVISQADEGALRNSQSYPLLVFGDEKVRQVRMIPNSNWKVYWFSYE